MNMVNIDIKYDPFPAKICYINDKNKQLFTKYRTVENSKEQCHLTLKITNPDFSKNNPTNLSTSTTSSNLSPTPKSPNKSPRQALPIAL